MLYEKTIITLIERITHLHTDLVQHEACCVVEETVSFPVELYFFLLKVMQH